MNCGDRGDTGSLRTRRSPATPTTPPARNVITSPAAASSFVLLGDTVDVSADRVLHRLGAEGDVAAIEEGCADRGDERKRREGCCDRPEPRGDELRHAGLLEP